MAQKDNEAEAPKKAAKKVIVIQDNSSSEPPKAAPKKITVSGDTPPVEDEAELEEIAEKIQSVSTNAVDPNEKSSEETEEAVSEAEGAAKELPKDITIEEAMKNASESVPSVPVEDIEPTDASTESSEAEVVTEQEAKNETTPEEGVEPQEATKEPEEEYSDTVIEKAVDDIVATESDELLAREDAQKEAISEPKQPKRSIGTRIKEFLKIPAVKWGMLAGLVVLLGALAALPVSRYAVLNAAGVRVGSSVVVMNTENQQPLKNAEVVVGGKTQNTNEKGEASFTGLKLGKTSVSVKKRGYAEVQQIRTLGWGSNPLGQVKMTVTGSQLTFVTKDFLSGKAVLGAEAVSGEFNAQADAEGKIVLPLDDNAEGDIEVTIKAVDYREEKITVTISDNTEKTVELVPAKQHVFISKRTGKLDIYKIDADGKNEAVLLAATGSEREDITVLPHPTKNYVAIVSTREGKRNKDNYLLSNVLVINVSNGEITKLPQSERIQLVDWTGDRIVFTAVTEGASAANAARSKLFSFEIGQPGAKEIAAANYFNDVVVFRGAVYYAPSSYSIPAASVKYFKINPDGSNVATMLDKEVWNIFRSDYDTLVLSVQQDWYEQKASGQPSKLGSAPANQKNRIYRESPDKKRALWTESRDGKGVLLSYDVESKKDDVLHTQSGLALPVSWLTSTTYVYRISDGKETADYVKSTEGGEPKKLRDVTNTEQYNYFN